MSRPSNLSLMDSSGQSTSSRAEVGNVEAASFVKQGKDVNVVIVVTSDMEFFERFFRKARRTVDYVQNGTSAVANLRTYSKSNEIPLMLITEELLSDMTGLELIEKVKTDPKLRLSGMHLVITSATYTTLADIDKLDGSLKGKGKAKADKENVFLIDDHRTSYRNIVKFFSNTSFEVTICSSHEEAEDCFDDPKMGSVRMVIADYRLLGDDANFLVTTIKLRNIPLIFTVSPGQSDLTAQRLMEAGAVMTIFKPIDKMHTLMLKPLLG